MDELFGESTDRSLQYLVLKCCKLYFENNFCILKYELLKGGIVLSIVNHNSILQAEYYFHYLCLSKNHENSWEFDLLCIPCS